MLPSRALVGVLALVAATLIVCSFPHGATSEEETPAVELVQTESLDLLDKMDDTNEAARASLARLRRIQKILMKKIDKKTSVIIDTVTAKGRGKRGPPGPKGFPGPAGRPGRTGVQGARGPRGNVGPRGNRGERGPTGPVGHIGATGDEGQRGYKGANGPKGFRGRKGPRGPEGEEGPRGTPGGRGPRGNVGATGMPGRNGNEGKMGPRGIRGPRGTKPHRGDDQADGVRLVSCQGECCRLEVLYNNQWGSVCDDGFTDDDAYVACRQVGYSGGRRRQSFGGGNGPIWLTTLSCRFTDTRIQDCPHKPWGQHNCQHNMDVGVCCTH